MITSSIISRYSTRIVEGVIKFVLEIKASGGIRNYDTAIEFIEAGATRIGTSSGVKIMNKEEE